MATNKALRKVNDSISIDEPITMEELVVHDGSLNGNGVKVLNGNGCNTNVMSHQIPARMGRISICRSVTLKLATRRKLLFKYNQTTF